MSFLGRYKFMIAIENGVCEDYITEKFWRPLMLGVIPIYFGSPSIRVSRSRSLPYLISILPFYIYFPCRIGSPVINQ